MEFITGVDSSDSEEDEVIKIINSLDSEVRSFTKENGLIRITPTSDEVADSIFSDKKFPETYHLDFVYYFIVDGKKKRLRNRLASISYSLSFPVQFYSDLIEENEDSKVQLIESVQDFKLELKKIVATKSFLRSLKRAKQKGVEE